MNKIAIIRVRGNINVRKQVKDTLKMLRLFNVNTCAVLNNTPSNIGMIKIAKDYITWGEIDKETFKLLLEKRGKLPGNKQLTEDYLKEKSKLSIEQFIEEFFNSKKSLKDIPGLKPFFKLHPPKGGFERKGIKFPFSMGGVLGYRKENINKLIKKML